MKTLKTLIGIAALMLAMITTQAQSVGSNIVTHATDWASTNTGIFTADRISVTPYVTYAPDIAAPKSKSVGGGIFLSYAVSDLVGAGVGLDYLGKLTMPSVNITLKQSLKPLAFMGVATNFSVTTFGIGGIAVPLSGAGADNHNLCTIYGAGVLTHLTQWKGHDVNIGGAWVKWDNAGDYSGGRLEAFVNLRLK